MTIGMHIALENPTRITAVGMFFLTLSVMACGGGGGGGAGGGGVVGAGGGAGSAGGGGAGGGAVAGSGGSGGSVAGAGGNGGRADSSAPGGASGGPDAGVIGGGADGGDAPAVPSGMACDPRTSLTLAIHIVVNVSWEGSLGTDPGTGAFHLWNLAKMTVNGTTLTGTTQPCGNALPPLTLRPLVGGGMALVEVPNAVWDLPTAPKFPTAGMLGGWTTGSVLMTTPTIALVGLTMPDPEAPWPASYTMLTPVDVEGDGNPGITGIPRMAAGFVQTPVSTPIAGLGPRADRLFLASRTGVGLNGTMTSCTEQSGTVTVSFFDNHVVGCHVNGGSDCTPAQTNFVDSNRTRYTVMGATFTSRFLPDGATCADARAN